MSSETEVKSKLNMAKQFFKDHKKAALIICAVSLVLGILLGIRLTGGLHKDKPVETPEPTMVSKLAYCKLSEIGELETAEFHFTMVQEYNSTNKDSKFIKKLLEELKKKHFLYSYDGSVKAGIDFTGIETVYDDAGKKVTVKLPSTQLREPTIDFDTLKVYLEEDGWFSKITLEDMNMSQKALTEAAKENAINIGILKTAEANAKNLIENMIHSTPGFEDYTVEFS